MDVSISELLTAQSRGYLPAMAAANLLDRTEMVTAAVRCGLVVVDKMHGEPYSAHLSTGAIDWDSVAYLSGGELATLQLAHSMVGGELCEWFWRLDNTRKNAVTAALNATIGA